MGVFGVVEGERSKEDWRREWHCFPSRRQARVKWSSESLTGFDCLIGLAWWVAGLMVMGIVDGCVLKGIAFEGRGFFFPKENFCRGVQAKCMSKRNSRGMLWLNPSLKPGSRRLSSASCQGSCGLRLDHGTARISPTAATFHTKLLHKAATLYCQGYKLGCLLRLDFVKQLGLCLCNVRFHPHRATLTRLI